MAYPVKTTMGVVGPGVMYSPYQYPNESVAKRMADRWAAAYRQKHGHCPHLYLGPIWENEND